MRFLASIAMASCLSTQAQVNFPFPDSAAIWVQYQEQMVTQPPMPQFEVTGISNILITGSDTLIDGTDYRKVEQGISGYIGAVREDSGRVFFVPADSMTAHLLYDFNALVGDTINDVFVDEGLAFSGWSSFPTLVTYVVDQVGLVSGRTWLRLQQPWGGPQQVWIEGFGSPYGLFARQDPLNVSGYWYGIWCMSHLDTAWHFSEFGIDSFPDYSCTPQYVGIQGRNEIAVIAYPNPTSDRVWVRTPSQTTYTITVTDQFGRKIQVPILQTPNGAGIDLTAVASGVYFITMTNAKGLTTLRVLKQ